MVRAIVGVIVGYSIWTAMWLGGNQLLFADAAKSVEAGLPYEVVGALIGVIGLSVACSLVAGVVSAGIAGAKGKQAGLVTAILLLLTGIGVQMSVWSLMPAWYHLLFLALIVPVVHLGATLVQRKRATTRFDV